MTDMQILVTLSNLQIPKARPGTLSEISWEYDKQRDQMQPPLPDERGLLTLGKTFGILVPTHEGSKIPHITFRLRYRSKQKKEKEKAVQPLADLIKRLPDRRSIRFPSGALLNVEFKLELKEPISPLIPRTKIAQQKRAMTLLHLGQNPLQNVDCVARVQAILGHQWGELKFRSFHGLDSLIYAELLKWDVIATGRGFKNEFPARLAKLLQETNLLNFSNGLFVVLGLWVLLTTTPEIRQSRSAVERCDLIKEALQLDVEAAFHNFLKGHVATHFQGAINSMFDSNEFDETKVVEQFVTCIKTFISDPKLKIPKAIADIVRAAMVRVLDVQLVEKLCEKDKIWSSVGMTDKTAFWLSVRKRMKENYGMDLVNFYCAAALIQEVAKDSIEQALRYLDPQTVLAVMSHAGTMDDLSGFAETHGLDAKVLTLPTQEIYLISLLNVRSEFVSTKDWNVLEDPQVIRRLEPELADRFVATKKFNAED